MIIQYILIAVILLLNLYFLSRRNSLRAKAWVKIIFLLLMLVTIISIMYPNLLTIVAKWLGVGRGADLLLYFLTLSFLFLVISIYLTLREQQEKIVKLARKIALIEKQINSN